MDSHYTTLYSSDEVNERIAQMASDIIRDYQSTRPLFVALLRGAAPFASKLMFEIARQAPNFQPEIDYMMVSTYGEDHTAKQPIIVTDLAPKTEVKGRRIIVLDDVIDLGITSDFVRETLLDRGAKEVALAVLGTKHVPSRQSQAEYIGFDCGDKWLVGMGLDDAHAGHEYYRWLEEIWAINKD